jgi:replicative DNA helicase
MIKLLTNIYQDMAVLQKNREFLKTGIDKIDGFLDGGLMRKELVVVGGYTGSGKSFLAGQWFLNMAMSGFMSAYFSLEISNEMIVSRLIGQIANIKPTRVMCGLLNEEENELRMKAKSKIAPFENFMHFSDDIYDLAIIEEAIKKHEYDFVVVDFVQNVLTKEKDEYSAMTRVSLEFQRMAKTYNCCIVLISQLSNSAAKAGYLEYKGSGGIAMVADLGFFITREVSEPEKFLLSIKKNRRGISGVTFDLRFIAPGGLIK